MSRRAFALLVALASLGGATVPLHAQSCSAPYTYASQVVCTQGPGDSPCTLAEPITFRVLTSGTPLSCATVVWEIDGVQAAPRPATDDYVATLPAGRHTAKALITVNGDGPIPQPQWYFYVGRGFVVSGDRTVTEGQTATFSVFRGNTEAETEIQWTATFIAGATDSGVSPTSGSFVMPAGESLHSFDITAGDDAVSTGQRAYRIAFTASNDYIFIDERVYTLYVEDNENAFIDFASAALSTTESAGTYQVEVVRSGITNTRVTVDYNVAAPGVYPAAVPGNGTLVFEPNQTSATITIQLNDNFHHSGTQSILVSLSNPRDGAAFPLPPSEMFRVISVADDEPVPTLIVDDVQLTEGDAGTTQATFTLRLPYPAIGLFVDWELVPQSAQAGADYQHASGGINFFDDMVRTVTVNVVGDTLDEPDETLAIHVTRRQGSMANMPSRDATLTILDDDGGDAPLPALTSIAPSSGPTAGGTAFEAHGTLLRGDCTLSFGGVPALNLALNLDGVLLGVTPAHAEGAVDVTLHCGASQSTLTNAFTYIAVAPALTSVAPGSGNTAGGTYVRAATANADSTCWLFFGGIAATQVRFSHAQELFAVAPPRAQAGNVDVTLRCGNESATLANGFTYNTVIEPAASITSLDPLSGAPGQSVTIHGTRFRPSDRISFDGTNATILESRPDAHVVRIPDVAPGMTSILLTDVEGRVLTTGPIFRVNEAIAPFVERITPSAVRAGAEVLVEGRGFRPGFTLLGGKLVSLAYTRAVVRLPLDLAPGTYVVDAASLTVMSTGVVLQSIAPACGFTSGGESVVLRGLGFTLGATVRLNGIAATNVQFLSSTELRATTPAGAAGLARVEVMNPNGAGDTMTDAFRYRSPLDPAGCGGKSRGVRH